MKKLHSMKVTFVQKKHLKIKVMIKFVYNGCKGSIYKYKPNLITQIRRLLDALKRPDTETHIIAL